jgi:hypothetical protein
MGTWSKFSLAFIATTAVVALSLLGHHGSTAPALGVTAPRPPSTPPPALVNPTPSQNATPRANTPVAPRYDDGDFKDVDPKPGSHELRAWALLDRATGAIKGSKNSATAHNSTESMIKVWIASDYLRRLGDARPSAERLRQIRGMIRDSNDEDAQAVWAADGRDAVVERLISTCGLANTKVWLSWWSRTQITAQDAVRMGDCIASGKAAGPKWTAHILDEMRHVRGEGRFGIVDALPADQQHSIAIKNGWTAISWDHSQWHVNCLGITDDWVMVVQVKYPIRLGLKYGAGYCQAQAAKVLSAN